MNDECEGKDESVRKEGCGYGDVVDKMLRKMREADGKKRRREWERGTVGEMSCTK